MGGGVRGEGPKIRGEEGQHEKQQISSNAKQTVLTLSLLYSIYTTVLRTSKCYDGADGF